METLVPGLSVFAGQPDTLELRDFPLKPLTGYEVLLSGGWRGFSWADLLVLRGDYFRRVAGRHHDLIRLGREVVARVEDSRSPAFNKGDACTVKVRRHNHENPGQFWATPERETALQYFCEPGLVGLDGTHCPQFVDDYRNIASLGAEFPPELGLLVDSAAYAVKGLHDVRESRRIKFAGEAPEMPARVLIIGAGVSGLTAARIFGQEGAEVVVVDSVPDNSTKARLVAQAGAKCVYQRVPSAVTTETMRTRVARVTGEYGLFDFVFDTAVTTERGLLWTEALAKGGMLIRAGVPHVPQSPDAIQDGWQRRALTVKQVGCPGGLGEHFGAQQIISESRAFFEQMLTPKIDWRWNDLRSFPELVEDGLSIKVHCEMPQ